MCVGDGDVDRLPRQGDEGESLGARRPGRDEAVGDDDVDLTRQPCELVFGEVDVVGAQDDSRVRVGELTQRIGQEVGERARQSGQGDLPDRFAEVALPVRLHAGDRAGHVSPARGEQSARGSEPESAAGGFDESVAEFAGGLSELLGDRRGRAVGETGDLGDAAVLIEGAEQFEVPRIEGTLLGDHEVMLHSR